MEQNEMLALASQRIQEHRTTQVEIDLVDSVGARISNAKVDVTLTRHAFKFGCNAFLVGQIADRELQAAYEERFADLLNYATLPFYWGGYEPTEGAAREADLRRMATWCADHGIATKGHPLVWHEVFPEWGRSHPDAEILGRLERRVKEIVGGFQGTIDIWDVVNEATVSHRYDNAVGRWMAEKGAATCVEQALRWAREANPEATLLYNDFNVSDDFEALVASLLDRGAPLDAIGIQSHMHRGPWPLERAWQACETYARFGLPLHWTELTVLSGRLKGADDNDWHAQQADWKSTPQGEAGQADYGEKLYTLLYSHPSVEAVTWWDFSDHHSWQGAPSGLVREDMTPKPLYERLLDLVTGAWSTNVQATSDDQGRVQARCFHGTHRVQATLGSGAVLSGSFAVNGEDERQVRVLLQPQ